MENFCKRDQQTCNSEGYKKNTLCDLITRNHFQTKCLFALDAPHKLKKNGTVGEWFSPGCVNASRSDCSSDNTIMCRRFSHAPIFTCRAQQKRLHGLSVALIQRGLYYWVTTAQFQRQQFPEFVSQKQRTVGKHKEQFSCF